MSGYFTAWVSLGLLSPFLLAAGAAECSEKETLLEPIPSSVSWPTECLLNCTWKTYFRKLQLQDKRNIRLQDSTEGKPGQYCWPTEIKCKVGESFQLAYLVLPVDLSVPGHDQLEVTSASSTFNGHRNHSTIPDACGLRYDVTDHFRPETRTTTQLCIQVVSQLENLGHQILKCTPMLVTFWARNQDLTKS